MATRSYIGKVNKDGTFTYIYCHNNGNVDCNGRTLMDFYTNTDKIDDLLALGSISSLRQDVSPPKEKEHTFDKPLSYVTVAYTRDRGESPWGPYTTNDLNRFVESTARDGDIEYIYVFGEYGWEVYCVREPKNIRHEYVRHYLEESDLDW